MIYAKTDFGRRAMQTREVRLSPCQRAVLIIVDGQKPVSELLRTAQSMGGGAADVDALVNLGLIAPSEAAVAAHAPANAPTRPAAAFAPTSPTPVAASAASSGVDSRFSDSQNLPSVDIFSAPAYEPPRPYPQESVYGNIQELEEVSGFTPEDSFQDAQRLAIRLLQPHGLRARQVLRAVEQARSVADLQTLAPLVHEFLTPGEAAAFDSMFGSL